MKRLVGSGAYARAKIYSGGLFVVFGTTIVVRMFSVAGPHVTALPGVVLGCAMIGLGALRIRDARAASRR